MNEAHHYLRYRVFTLFGADRRKDNVLRMGSLVAHVRYEYEAAKAIEAWVIDDANYSCAAPTYFLVDAYDKVLSVHPPIEKGT